MTNPNGNIFSKSPVANAAKKENILEKLAQLVMVGAAKPPVSLCGAVWRGLRLGKSRDKFADQ